MVKVPAGTLFAALLSLVFVTVVTLLDATCCFEGSFYPLRFLATGIYLISPVMVFIQRRPVRAMVAGSVIWALLILPSVRWNHDKSFYVDARSLEIGMSSSEVLQVMKPYLEVREGAAFDGEGNLIYRPPTEEQQWPPWALYPGRGWIFLHSVIGWTDHCEVWFDGEGRVRDIAIEKD